jgi:hypothetical protein
MKAVQFRCAKKVDLISIENNKCVIAHIRKKLSMVSNRDMIEKKFKFRDGKSHYIYCSCIPEEIRQSEEGYVRIEIIFAILKF